MSKCYSIKFNEFLERGREDDFVMAFREFLTSEHNQMTLDLIYEIEDFKKCEKEDYKKRYSKAEKMIQLYIGDHSSRQVNLPASLKDQCLLEFQKSQITKIGNKKPDLTSLETIFDKIYSHLHYSLKSDNFFRFISSDIFVKCILQNLQTLKQKLVHSNSLFNHSSNHQTSPPRGQEHTESTIFQSPLPQQQNSTQQLWINVLELFFNEIGEKKLLPSSNGHDCNTQHPSSNSGSSNNHNTLISSGNNSESSDSSGSSIESSHESETNSNVSNSTFKHVLPSSNPQLFLNVNHVLSESSNSLSPSSVSSAPASLSPRSLNQQLLTKDLTQLAIELDEILEDHSSGGDSTGCDGCIRRVHEKHFRFIHSLAMANNLFTKIDPPLSEKQQQEHSLSSLWNNGSNTPTLVPSMNWTCAYTVDLKHPKKKKSFRLFKQTGILNASPLEVLYSILDAEYARVVGDQMNEEAYPLEYLPCEYSSTKMSNSKKELNSNEKTCCQEFFEHDGFHSTWATKMLFKLGFPLKSREFLVSMSLRNETLAMWDLNGTRSEQIFREICKDPYSNFTLVRVPYQYHEEKIEVARNHTRGIFFGGTIIEKVSENQARFTLVSHINMNTKIPTSLYYNSARNRTVEVISSIQFIVEILRKRKKRLENATSNPSNGENLPSEIVPSSSNSSSCSPRSYANLLEGTIKSEMLLRTLNENMQKIGSKYGFTIDD
ncbi:hypothetical protein FDP41_008531 [Naegleria fowleri]|uniref:RGS domain-containing protein n=1 Tax=Naegleria fowleri TaxID=5763 RepID=A0A6A5BH23_NAEFO|nr:uncharacterized protein FDP41_008531 [Naegleria fowleri]KAF0973324.1 hypothetical protein FDP41_008531 [Naegleria fowleri]